MRFFGRSLIGLFLFAATLGLLAWGGQITYGALQERWADEGFDRPSRERVFSVRVMTYEPGEVVPELTSFGDVLSQRTLDLRAPAAGRIMELSPAFEDGGQVRAGEVLARIDPADAEAALDVARTDMIEAQADLIDAQNAIDLAGDEVEAARAQLELRQRSLERQQDLARRGVGTSAAVEEAELAVSAAAQAVLSRRQALQTAQARLTQTETLITRRDIAVRDAERRLADTAVTAEFDGTLAEVDVTAGGLVALNELMARLVDPTALEVSFRVSTAQYARLLDSEGALTPAEVEVRLDVLGTDLVVPAKLTRESAAVAEGTTGRLLFAELERSAGLRPGDFVTVVTREPALQRVAKLPAAALGADGTLLVLGEEDRLEEVEAELLRRQGDDVIVRARGLAGREVVTERSQVLGAGIKVKPLRQGGAVAAAPETVELDPERRARLIAFVEANTRIPEQVKARMLTQLQEPAVPARMVARLESRMGS